MTKGAKIGLVGGLQWDVYLMVAEIINTGQNVL